VCAARHCQDIGQFATGQFPDALGRPRLIESFARFIRNAFALAFLFALGFILFAHLVPRFPAPSGFLNIEDAKPAGERIVQPVIEECRQQFVLGFEQIERRREIDPANGMRHTERKQYSPGLTSSGSRQLEAVVPREKLMSKA